ncbi:MAG: hypothetical protein WCL57_00330 [Chloroflexota bacterium]
MIIARTPYRISFFGGGTDYPGWYREHGGAVIAATIDKYCYLTVRHLPPFFEHRHRVVWSKIEQVGQIDEISHPAVRGILKYAGVERGLEIHHDGDLPARSGMGSSSAFTVSLLNALHGLHGQMTSKHKLAMEAIHVEQTVLKETVGSQDQVSAAYGGFNHIRFLQNGEISVAPITVSSARAHELDSHLMLFYTGIKRTHQRWPTPMCKILITKNANYALCMTWCKNLLRFWRVTSPLMILGRYWMKHGNLNAT